MTDQMKRNVAQSALDEAKDIRDLAKEYCPEDKGKLTDSIEVVESSSGHGQGRNQLGQFTSDAVITVTVKAGGPDVPHALAVHEYPSQHNPPSWEGTDVHFKKGGPKFLERAMKDISSGMVQRIGNRVLKG
jgi:uncharacterized protein YodC (DUF2158 family)